MIEFSLMCISVVDMIWKFCFHFRLTAFNVMDAMFAPPALNQDAHGL